MTNIGLFQAGCQYHIQQNTGNQICKICGRQSHKPKHPSECREGNHCQNGNACHGQKCHRGRGTALQKRQLRGTNHMNNQCLAPHGFHKPPCLEQPDIPRLHCRKLCAAIVCRQVIEQNPLRDKQRAEHKIHKDVSCEIKDGAGRPNPNHKAAHTGGIPFSRLCDKFLIHIIPWKDDT